MFFRENTRKKALELNVFGFVRNLQDGRVEAIIEGEKDKVEKLIEWMREGPGLARVDNIEINFENYQGMRKAFKKYGIKIKIEKNFGIPEIQADTCEEVAEFSAKWTAEKIKKPVLSGDTGLFVEALNGLPGVYTSQFHKKLGIERFMKLLKDETNRNAKLVYALSFCEPNKDPITFSNITEGKITEKVNIVGSFIDSIFIPKGEKEVIGIIRKKDPNKIHMFFGNIEERFARWYVKNKKDLL